MVGDLPDWSYGRPTWFDRAPTDQTIWYEAGPVAPHGITVRATYTPPAGRNAWVENAFLLVQRQTAAGAASLARANLRYTPSGGAAEILATAQFWTNAVGDGMATPYGGGLLLVSGDTIDLATGDVSTGGACWYTLSAKITEFDA